MVMEDGKRRRDVRKMESERCLCLHFPDRKKALKSAGPGCPRSMKIEREDATLPAATLIVPVVFVFIFANIFYFFYLD
jgi:hypothetical protein